MKALNALLIAICSLCVALSCALGADSQEAQERDLQDSVKDFKDSKDSQNSAFFSPKTGASVVEEPPNPYRFPKDGAYYLNKNAAILESFVQVLRKQTLESNFAFYDRRFLVEHSAYRMLTKKQKDDLKGAIVLTSGFLSSFIKYRHLGGVGIGMRINQHDEDMFYLSFDGRYLSDLDALGLGAKIYAYCVLPRFDKCIMLGISEEW